MIMFLAICSTSNWRHSPQFGEMCPESLLDTKLISSSCGYTPKCWDISPVSLLLKSESWTKVVHVFKLTGMGPSNMFEDACRNLRLPQIHIFVGKYPERELKDRASPTKPVRFSNSVGREPDNWLPYASRFWRFCRFPKVCGIDPEIWLSQKIQYLEVHQVANFLGNRVCYPIFVES